MNFRKIGSLLFFMVFLYSSQYCSAQSSGSIVGWGERVMVEPEKLTDIVSIAAGEKHNLALASNGSVIAWGNNLYCPCYVPAPNANFVAVSASLTHHLGGISLGLTSDGTIVAWGCNGNPGYDCDVPPPNEDFVAIAVSNGAISPLKYV